MRAAATPGAGQSLADMVERARAGVVRVVWGSGSGSGFVVDSEGHILTNEHVIDGARRVTVVFDDGARLSARGCGGGRGEGHRLAEGRYDPPPDAAALCVERARRGRGGGSRLPAELGQHDRHQGDSVPRSIHVESALPAYRRTPPSIRATAAARC